MRRIVLPAVILMAISVITVGIVIGAASGANDPTTAITNRPVDQNTGASGTTQPRVEGSEVISTDQLTADNTGNWRHPGVAEDSRGNRLVIFRGPEGNSYYYVYCAKGGTWSSPASIAGGNQPSLISSLYANIQVDSTDRFHCEWENANAAVYASFKDGVWTTPAKLPITGRYDQTSSLTVSSTDEVLTVACGAVGFSKDIFIDRKGKNDNWFGSPFNLTRDPGQGSTQPCVAVDSNDNAWVVWKSDYHVVNDQDNLVIFLAPFLPNNQDGPIDWIVMSPDPGWSFLPQVAVNSEDKVMTIFATSTYGQYLSRLYDPATKKLGPLIPLNIGLCMQPWHTFFSRLVSHGTAFYAAAMTPGRILILLKFDENTSQWNQVAQVSDRSVEMFALYSGYDKMLIVWNSFGEPSNVFITTAEVEPFSKIRVNSASNLMVEKKEERGFFHGYFLNILTWEANPENIQRGVTVTAQRVYRETLGEDNSKWTRIAEVSGTVLRYEDRNVPSDSDYVYVVTCVDDKGNESAIF